MLFTNVRDGSKLCCLGDVQTNSTKIAKVSTFLVSKCCTFCACARSNMVDDDDDDDERPAKIRATSDFCKLGCSMDALILPWHIVRSHGKMN